MSGGSAPNRAQRRGRSGLVLARAPNRTPEHVASPLRKRMNSGGPPSSIVINGAEPARTKKLSQREKHEADVVAKIRAVDKFRESGAGQGLSLVDAIQAMKGRKLLQGFSKSTYNR